MTLVVDMQCSVHRWTALCADVHPVHPHTVVAGAGMSAEMHTLFRFWGELLGSNFNRALYSEFYSLAAEGLGPRAPLRGAVLVPLLPSTPGRGPPARLARGLRDARSAGELLNCRVQ